MENASWLDGLGGMHQCWPDPKKLAEFEIMLESGASKHLEMKNAGWMGWVASFHDPASIGTQKVIPRGAHNTQK